MAQSERRHKLVLEIYKHADVIGANKTTIVFLLAVMNDKTLTKFHKEFMVKEPYTKEEQIPAGSGKSVIINEPLVGEGIRIGPWVVIDGYCATRAVLHTDPDVVHNRVAFIEKTPRVRETSLGAEEEEWDFGPKGSGGAHTDDHEKLGQYGFDPESRAWCDKRLVELGYVLDE